MMISGWIDVREALKGIVCEDESAGGRGSSSPWTELHYLDEKAAAAADADEYDMSSVQPETTGREI